MWFGVPLPLVTALCRVESLLLGLEVLLRDRGIRSHDWRRGTRGRARHNFIGGEGDTPQAVACSFTQPLPRPGGVGLIDIADRRARERFAKGGHAVFPLLIPDHRQPFDVGEVLQVELDVLP